MLFYSHFVEAGREPDGATHLEPANPIKSDINKYNEKEKKVKSINTLPSYGGTLPRYRPQHPSPRVAVASGMMRFWKFSWRKISE
jgi:hypothetical protein